MDESTLENLANLICGDEKGPVHRSGSELSGFFRRAGLPRFEHDGSTRKSWTLDTLQSCQPREIKKVIERLASPKEYGGDPEKITEAVEQLNQILATEGLKVELDGGDPRIVSSNEVTYLPRESDEREPLPRPDFSALNVESEVAELLRLRWQEAQKCIDTGAHLAAIVMMGSLLEGILLGVLNDNPRQANQSNSTPKDQDTGKPKKFKDWSFFEMIEVAHDVGWLRLGTKKFSHSLREFRNLIHLYEQLSSGARPDEDTCAISWRVVQAAVNNLSQVLSHSQESV